MKQTFTSSLVKYCNRVLKVMLLVVMACNMSGVFAVTSLTTGFSDQKTHIIEGDATWDAMKRILNEGTIVIIKGDFTINQSMYLFDKAILVVEGDLTISSSKKLYIYNEACAVVKGELKGSGQLLLYRNSSNETDYTRGNFISLEGGANSITYKLGEDGTNHIYIKNRYENNEILVTNEILAKGLGLLPIELTSFSIFATADGFTFNWVTASEVNNDYFTLEYSIDGVNFNEIDYVHGAGTTSETSEYEYRWDEVPDFEMIYFRLKQTDYNGEYSYSDVLVSSRKKSSGANGTFRYGPLNLQIQDGELRYIQK